MGQEWPKNQSRSCLLVTVAIAGIFTGIFENVNTALINTDSTKMPLRYLKKATFVINGS